MRSSSPPRIENLVNSKLSYNEIHVFSLSFQNQSLNSFLKKKNHNIRYFKVDSNRGAPIFFQKLSNVQVGLFFHLFR